MRSSDNLLNLIVHRETRCLLFEISTEFAGVKVIIKIKKRVGFYKRLDAKFRFFPVVEEKLQWQTELLLMK